MMSHNVTQISCGIKGMFYEESRLQKRLEWSGPLVESIYALIARIDAVRHSLDINLFWGGQVLDRLTRSVIITSTGASNRIEGNRLSNIEVENLYKKMHIKEFKTRDEQEIVGYVECLERIFEYYNDMPITESTILGLHHAMMAYSEKDAHHRGQYKTGSNRVEARDHRGAIVGIVFDPAPPWLVQKEMSELTGWYAWAVSQKKKHPLILVANLVFEYLAIHPFQDGNGRTSRLLTNLALLQNDYFFTKIVSHESIIESIKIDYYIALNKTQSTWKKEQEDMAPWVMFFLRVVHEQAQKALELLKEDHTEHLLSEKQLALLRWAQNNRRAFSRKDAVEELGFPPRTVESIIIKLEKLGKIKRAGQGRATRYTPL